MSAWTDTEETDQLLATANSLFGSETAWFVRDQYIALYEQILSRCDQDGQTLEIVHGSAGVGKSSFLVYALARLRLTGKCALLYFRPKLEAEGVSVFFPPFGGQPTAMPSNETGHYRQFMQWYKQVGEARSLFFVDGNVTFNEDAIDNVTFVVAKSPSSTLGWMDKGKAKNEHWLSLWQEDELVRYGRLARIEGIEQIVRDNFFYMGGIARYALKKGEALSAIDYALRMTNGEALMKVVTIGIQGKDENRKIVDRLLHYHDPRRVVPGLKPFAFASAYVASRVAQALYLEMSFSTAQLLAQFQGVGPLGSFRGVLFEAYTARKLSEGGTFAVKKIGSSDQETLQISATTIYQKPTNVLNTTNFPPADVKDKIVWPNPEFNLPAIDMLMFLNILGTCVGFQITVSLSHTLSLKGILSALRYFDSVCREMNKMQPPRTYRFYFAVPPDIYDKFSNRIQAFVDKAGAVVRDDATEARVEQWILKVE